MEVNNEECGIVSFRRGPPALTETPADRATTKKWLVDRLTDGRLTPRFHNGIGFAQVYLNQDVRLHVWHPDLPAEPEAFGCRHNHRFDFQSKVLLGSLTNITYDIWDDSDGYFFLYNVKPAHEGPAIPERADDYAYWANITDILTVKAGDSYSFPRWMYHEGRANGVTATVIKKANQVETWANIIAPRNQLPEHGMERCTIEDSALRELMLSVVAQFDDAAWEAILKMMIDE